MSKEFLETISFTVTNLSGITQNYAIFAGEPEIKPKVLDIRNDIFTSFRGVASHGGRAYFTMPRYQLSAICGTYIRSNIESGIQIEIVDRMSITLGSTSSRGTVCPGTTCEVIIEDGSPVFAKQQHTVADGGNVKCFCVQTRADFTYQEASSNRYVIGWTVATSTEMNKNIGPFALFCPMPKTSYQIKPSTTYYIIAGDYPTRAPTPQDLESQAFKIELDQLNTSDVALIHDDNGNFQLRTAKAML